MSKIEKIENYFPNGMLREKGTKKDGKYVGKWFGCYETGEKEVESNYKDGRLEDSINWYKNGNKKWERTGYYNGKETRWYENGNKEYELNIKDTLCHGIVNFWDENGQKVAKVSYINGKVDGKMTSWRESGEKKEESFYKDDKFISYWMLSHRYNIILKETNKIIQS